ncbi:MAG: carboxylating nicotinate-nucleotide diphosphorylase [Gammaproteobacteria bacterium]|nr:carboxylating nicotinate-nucleotide diphosphorylase [Gammaproteobacteria bacterium]
MNAPPAHLLATIDTIVRLAIAEDVGSGDVTAAIIPPDHVSTAHVLTREDCVLCGRPWFDRVFALIDPAITITWLHAEGDEISADTRLCRLQGPTRGLLTGERTALNFLQTLAATATETRRYARQLEGCSTRLLDLRKTIPGLRHAQKYAVAIGGGSNHRIGLYDAILLKENHIAAAGSITAAITACRRLHPGWPIEVEVETLDEVREAIAAGAETLLLDNFTLPMMREARALVPPSVRLEASGDVNLDNIRTIAETGVDFISVGALTKHVRAINLSLLFDR